MVWCGPRFLFIFFRRSLRLIVGYGNIFHGFSGEAGILGALVQCRKFPSMTADCDTCTAGVWVPAFSWRVWQRWALLWLLYAGRTLLRDFNAVHIYPFGCATSGRGMLFASYCRTYRSCISLLLSSSSVGGIGAYAPRTLWWISPIVGLLSATGCFLPPSETAYFCETTFWSVCGLDASLALTVS